MRNYVIINGVNSLTKNGLAIKDLPPITKTMMRTLREEIDGRDGDIITELGYSAYDKSMTIGLFGTGYDIDDIIAFFNQSGTIVFSNEPDKFYNFKIIDQIDYNKLLKFKEATIRFHCQPFKYPLNEIPLVEEYQYVEATGTDITLNNTSAGIFNKFDLLGNTSQNGTPTPSSPIPVNVVSGDNTIDITGKNLYNPNYRTSNNNIYVVNGTARESDGEFTLTATNTDLYMWQIASAGNAYNKDIHGKLYKFIEDEYTISVTNHTMVANYITFFDENFVSLGFISFGGVGYYKTFKRSDNNVPSNAKYFGFRIGYNHAVAGQTYTFSVQLEVGSTATTYEPYIGNTYPISLGTLELCKIGTYQDYIYKDNGSWYLHKEIGKVVLDGSESWERFGAFGTIPKYLFYLDGNFNGKTTDTPASIGIGYSNLFKWAITSNGTDNYQYIRFQYLNGNRIYVAFDNDKTISEFKNWASENNIEAYYVLATPTNTLIEDTTLIEQLEELKLATSYEGQTNIAQTNNDLPFILDLSALELNSDHLVVNNIGNIYSKPTLDLEGTGIVDIYLNNIQMFEVDLTENNEIIINTDEMEAFNPETGALANRQVTGEYDVFKLDPGENDLRFSGNLTKATITNYERWL